ncbi:MAG: CDP-glycerol glycerophosphotransferase family protein [Actinomycetales bacterium]|nr:CDP-glycerol glycerophosphotransferase family protein [Actinomycetales bacterium]
MSGESAPVSRPDVTIVVVTAGRGQRATLEEDVLRTVDSARMQTLYNLEILLVMGREADPDSASASGSQGLVGRRLAALDDQRLRLVQHETTDLGALLSRGLAEAAGTWIMFCQSGDRLRRHAAKSLLLAVEHSGADIGCALTEVLDADGIRRHWRAQGHHRGDLDSVAERPELLADVQVAGKLFRRDWVAEHGPGFAEGLPFPEEDFVLGAYLSARGISVIPQRACVREEMPPSGPGDWDWVRLSRDRVQALVRTDVQLDRGGTSSLVSERIRSVLADELPVYLGAMLEVDDASAQAIAQAWQAYALTCDLAQAACLAPALRIALYHLLIGDLEGIRSAMRCDRWSAVIEAPIRNQDGRQVWACEHLRTGPSVQGLEAAWWLDVTAMAIIGAPVDESRPCHLLLDARTVGRTFIATGTTEDTFSLLARASHASLAIVCEEGRTLCSIPLQVVLGEPVAWKADAPWIWESDAVVDPGASGTLQLVLRVDGRLNRMPVRTPASRAPRMPVRLGRGVVVSLGPGRDGSAAWTVVRSGWGWRTWRLSSGVMAGLASLLHRQALMLASRLATALPARSVIAFEAFEGRAFTGHPRALSEVLSQERPDIRQVWSYVDRAEHIPAWARAVRQGTLRHRLALSSARWWVSDGTPPQVIRKHARNRWLQTWRGQPIACLGSAELDAPMTRRVERRPPAWQVRRWDLLLSPSQYFSDDVVPALGFTGDLVGQASPFGAAVLAAADDPRLRERLGLPPDRRIVLLATSGEPPGDIPGLVATIGSRAFLLVARDSGISRAPDPSCGFAVRDVTASDDWLGYLACADAMVTDGSVWTLDYARLCRPIMLWEPGYQSLRRVHGTFLSLPDLVPGPTVRTPAELIVALERWLEGEPNWPSDLPQRAASLARIAGPAEPSSARRCAQVLITGRVDGRGSS